MTRTTARDLAVRLSFALSANNDAELDTFFDEEYFATLAGEDIRFAGYPDEKQMQYIRELVLGVRARCEELDAYIDKYAQGWKTTRISRIAVTVLQCAMYEILYMPDVPDAAAINEAVELAKDYEEPDTVAFINGILGSFIRAEVGGLAASDGSPADDDEGSPEEPPTPDKPQD